MEVPKIKTAYGVKFTLRCAMRILLVTKVPPPATGEAIALRNMMDQYLMLGWQVDMLCMITPSIPTVLLTSRNNATYNMVPLQKCMQIPARANGVACSTCWKWGYHMQFGLTNLLFRQALTVLLQGAKL